MSEIIIPIPARLKNVAKNGHVAGAEDIIDDALNKEQSTINQETLSRLDAVQQKVDDIGDSIQFDEDGDLVTEDGSDFDDDTARGKIPTVGAILDGLNDGVYDVSKRNPTAGPNSDGKFTLEYILDNANTLIPNGWRHGGMTISFVDSSDNKYVQYRYLLSVVTAYDFTRAENWQGVDEEPVAGYLEDNNLIKSTGVGNKIMLLNIVSDSAIQRAYKLKANASYHIRNNSTAVVTISRRVEYNGTAYDIVNVVGKATIVYTPTADGNFLCAGDACNLDVCPVDSIIDKVAFAEEYYDNTPTANSNKPVKSKGIKTYVDNSVNNLNTSILNDIKCTNITSGSEGTTAFKLVAGTTYHVRNNSNSSVTISNRETPTGTSSDVVNLSAGTIIDYTPTVNGNYIRYGGACNIDICVKGSISDLVYLQEAYSDNVPTANSKKTVKSGGVKTAIDAVGTKLNNIANVIVSLETSDGYINTSTSTLDETVIAGNFAHYIGNCSAGDKFVITGRGGESPLLWSFWNSSNQKISASGYNVGATNLELTAPANAAKVVFNSSKSVAFSFRKYVSETQQQQDEIIQSIITSVEDLSSSVRRIKEIISIRDITYPADAYTSLGKSFKRGSKIKISANFNNIEEDVFFTIYDKKGNTLGYRYKSAANFSKEIIATFEIGNIVIYFPSTVTSGTKMSNIKFEAAYDVVEYDELNSQFKSSGNYQFGLKGNGAYQCPSIPALPQQSETNCAYFYALYDALALQYPNYITKVDCDAEMVADGYTRPSELSNLPIYMYKFIPKYAPSVFSGEYKTLKSRLKVYIVTGTHPEYMGIYDTYQTMRLICEQWENDANLQELRWNAEFYIIPCSGPYGINMGSRTNYNGVDLNRNAPSNDWRLAGYGTDDYSGPEPASEYETKLMMHYFDAIKPNIFIDHHNMDSVSKVLIWPSCRYPFGVDVAASLIADMTAAWKKRSQTQDEDFADIFPSNADDDTTMFGVAQYGDDPGMRSSYASDNGAIGFTYESQASISYANGEFDASHKQTRTKLCCTCATEGFINFLYRLLKSYSMRYDA